MKALKIIYALLKVYVLYYSAYMIYRLIGSDAIPLFIAIGLLIVVRGAVYYCLAKRWED